MLKYCFIFIGALLLFSCVEFTKWAGSYGPFMTTKGRACVEGEKDCFELRQCKLPVHYSIKLDYDIPPQAEGDIMYGFETWNQILGFRMFIFEGYTTMNPEFENTPGIIVVSVQTFLSPAHEDHYGWAQLKWGKSTGCIYDSDVFLAPRLFQRSHEHLLRTVMVHEVGHILGLEHTLNDNDIMRRYIRGFQSPGFGTFGAPPDFDPGFLMGRDYPSAREQDLVRKKYAQDR